MITATWAGLPAPSPNDELRLYTLGSLTDAFEEVASWPTTGAANGTLQLTLPNPLVPGIHTYELRVLSGDPESSNLLGVMARSQPVRVGTVAASVDLVVTAVATTPAQPAAGQPLDVAVTVTNQGTAAAGAFAVDVYKHRTTSPTPGTPGDVQCPIASLAPGAAVACTRTVTYATAGAFSLWAQVDTGQTIPEANEGNNVFGPRSITVAAAPPGPADLVVVAVSDPPAGALPGGRFSVSDTVSNRGAVTAAPSSTRYYLSLDDTKNAGDTLLTGLRAVPALAHTAESLGSVFVTIPVAIPPAIYRLLACADDTAVVAEGNEGNNCLAAAGSIIVGLPDLVVTAVSNPPAAARPGTSFTVTDTVLQQLPRRHRQILDDAVLPLARRRRRARPTSCSAAAAPCRSWPAPRSSPVGEGRDHSHDHAAGQLLPARLRRRREGDRRGQRDRQLPGVGDPGDGGLARPQPDGGLQPRRALPARRQLHRLRHRLQRRPRGHRQGFDHALLPVAERHQGHG